MCKFTPVWLGAQLTSATWHTLVEERWPGLQRVPVGGSREGSPPPTVGPATLGGSPGGDYSAHGQPPGTSSDPPKTFEHANTGTTDSAGMDEDCAAYLHPAAASVGFVHLGARPMKGKGEVRCCPQHALPCMSCHALHAMLVVPGRVGVHALA